MYFSSPESKAQLNFSDKNLPIVNLFIFVNFPHLSPSPEKNGQFKENLTQSILGETVFEFV